MLIQVLILFLLSSIAYPYFVPPVLFGNVVRDLYSNSTNDMNMLATQWTSYEGDYLYDNVIVDDFFGELMLGVSSIVYRQGSLFRTYDQLPAHNVIYFEISFGGIPWYLDMVQFSISSYNFQISPGISQMGALVGRIYDSSSSLIIAISYSIDVSHLGLERWVAFRDISLSLRTEESPVPPSATYILNWIPTSLTPIDYNSNMIANCSSGYYLNGTACVSCHASCKNCFGPSNTECYSCASGFSFIGNQCLQCPLNCAFCSGVNLGQCLFCNTGYTLDFDGTCNPSNTCNTSPFVIKTNADVSPSMSYSSSFCAQPCSSGAYTLWNYTCTNTCSPPLQQVSINGALLCQFPCNKTNNEYLHPNGSCLSSCSYSPINETGYLFCGSFCQNYLYQNQSCLPTCPAPYVTGVSLGVNTCNYPCATGQYLFPNGSCIATCPQLYTVRVENSSLFCSYPCASNEYLYSNGTCSPTCQNNFLIAMDGTDKFCNYPCQIGSYLYDNGTCLETCSPGFTASAQGLYQYCSPSCPSNNYLYYNGICLSSCPVGTYQGGGTCNICDSSCITCNGPLASQCLSCHSNRFLMNGKCLCPNDAYLYANGSCLSSCQSGFSVVIEGGITYCNSPNSSSNGCNNSSLYKYQNGSCLSTCPYPFTSEWQNGTYFCNNPCSAGWFLYENGTCLPSCGPGFETRIEDSITFCDSNQTTNSSNSNPYPCYITSLYDTNIMITNCSNLNQNNACPPDYFQYQNGSCLHLCIDPYYGILRNGSAYCYSPSSFPDQNSCLPGDNSTTNSTGNSTNNNNTSTNQTDNGNSTTNNNTDTNNSTTYTNGCSGANFYKYSNGSCLATCPSPFVFVWQNGAAYCDFPCAPGYYISINGTCITSCDPGYTPRIQGYLMFCDSINVSNGTSSGGTNSSQTNTTNTTNTPSVLLQIYIRYNISLIDFNSLDGLTLFVQQLATLLGIDPSYITIVSIREGSTIIESQISIASASDQESMNTAMSLAETMSDTVSNAVTNNELNIISGVSILDYKKSIQVVKTATSDNQIQVSSGSSNNGAVIGLGVGLGVLGLIVISFAINRYKKNTRLKNLRTKQDSTKGEAYKVEVNVNKINQEVKDESMARINDYKEGETVKSHRLDEIDIRIEGSGINNKQSPEQQAIELDVQAINIEPKFIEVERKASTNQEYKLEPNMSADQEMRNDSSFKSQGIQVCNEIEPTKQLSFVQPESSSSSSIEGLDFYIEGKTDQQDQQEDHNADVDIIVEGREVENQNIEKQEDVEEKPMSLGALLKQNL